MIPEYTKRAIDNYNKKIKNINIPFNMDKPEEKDIYNFLLTVNKTSLVKQLVKQYMEENNNAT